MEYDWFYLESLANNFIFRTSSSAAGDAVDYLNRPDSPVNGSPFVSSATQCFSMYGPGWYSGPSMCCWVSVFGNNGFAWASIGSVKVARMMVRIIQ